MGPAPPLWDGGRQCAGLGAGDSGGRQWWEVPWREVAALCECDRTETVTRNICVGCGVIFHGEGLFCSRCFAARRDEVLQCSARERRYFRSMMPRKGR